MTMTRYLSSALLAAALWCGAADSPWGIAAHPHSEMEWKNIDRQLDLSLIHISEPTRH